MLRALITDLTQSAQRAAMAIILTVGIATALLGASSYYSEIDNVEQLVTASSSNLQHQINHTFLGIEDFLADTAGRINVEDWPDPKIQPWLQGRLSSFPEISAIVLIKPNGYTLSAGLTARGEIGRPVDVSDRDYFKHHLNNPEDSSLFIGAPMRNRLDGRASIPVSKPIVDNRGKLQGIILALVDPRALEGSMMMMRARGDAFSMLVRIDGTVLSRAPSADVITGQSVASEPFFQSVRDHPLLGVGTFASPMDGERQILSYRALGRYPLIVAAGVPRWGALSQWRDRFCWVLGIIGALLGALYSLAYLSDRRELQRRVLSAAAETAERQARQVQQQFVDAIETIQDGIALYDETDHLVLCNAQYQNMAEGLVADVIVPGARFKDIVRAAAERGLYTFEGRTLEGFIAARLAEHKNPTGKAVMHPVCGGRWMVSREFRTRSGGVVATRSDITELRMREFEVESVKKRYELILDSAGDGILGIASDDTITFANHAANVILGQNKDDLLGRNFRKALCANMAALSSPLELEGDATLTGEESFVSGGREFIAEYVLAPIFEDECYNGAVLVFRDISLRKQYEATIASHQKELEQLVAERTRELSAEIEQRSRTEEALRKNQGRLMGITANLVEGVLLVDVFGHILFANTSAHKLLVNQTRALSGTDLDEAMKVLVGDQTVEFEDSPLKHAIEAGEPVIDDDATFVTQDGRRLSVGFAAAPLIEDGKRRGAVISFRNIEVLKTAQREALQSSRLASVGQLAAGIAHEINTPIQYIGDNLRFFRDSMAPLGKALKELKTLAETAGQADQAASLFAENDCDYLLEELPQAASQSLQGVDHVAHIVRSMKDFSHPGTTAKVATDINRAVDSTLTVCRNEWKHVAEVETTLDPDLPHVLCFPADINQVLLNLVINAAQAIESTSNGQMGKIHISTRVCCDGYVEIRVQDNGPGVPKSIRDKIFDPFFTTKEVGKGTGQGLSISLDVICNKHGGRLVLDEIATGAAFIVQLPINGPPCTPREIT